MSEYRYNRITDQWVIIAGDRNQRPTDFQKGQKPKETDFDQACPFCPGHETMTPPETFAIRPADTLPDTDGWTVRVVPNKYPALQTIDNRADTNIPLRQQPGVGHHEVIIESPHHSLCMGHHESDHAEHLCRVLRDRYRHFAQSSDSTKLVTIFYNHGATSGASLCHPHFQLLAQSVIPPRLCSLLRHCQQYYDQYGQSVFDAVIESELTAGQRIVTVTDDFVVFCPFASRSPFEIYLLPRCAQSHFGQLDDTLLKPFSEVLQQTLRCVDEQLGSPDYNMAFHTAPSGDQDYPGFRWYIQICPRVSITGGFELATDVFINTIPPETAAQFLREPI